MGYYGTEGISIFREGGAPGRKPKQKLVGGRGTIVFYPTQAVYICFGRYIIIFWSRSKISRYSPEKKNSQKALDPTTAVRANKKAPSSEGGNSTKNGGMWTLKHEIRTPKLYELLIET